MFDDTTRYGLLKILEGNPGLSQRNLAERLGVSLGKVNFCLKALIKMGCLYVGNFRNSENKLSYAYLLTPKGAEQKSRMAVEFLKVKTQEYQRLSAELAELKREVEKISGEHQ